MLTVGLQQADKLVINRATLSSILLTLIGLRRHCRVMGDSMIPTLKSGDIIIYKPFNKKEARIKPGSLVVINHPLEKGTLIIKRVQESSSKYCFVRGDNEKSSKDSREFGYISNSKVKGIVELILN